MKRAFFCTLLAALGFASTALAWEAKCFKDNPTLNLPRTALDYVNQQHGICSLANPPDASVECAPGFDAARGVFLGEHGWISFIGLRWAGLEWATAEALPTYWVDGETAFTGVPSLVPAGLAAIKKVPVDSHGYDTKLHRNVYLSDLSELPDTSYGFSDFLMGNEHCPAANVPKATQADVVACHTYESHVAIVNSTHFSPQNRHVYWIYHELARERAKRCKAMKQGFDALSSNHFLGDDDKKQKLAACEEEALALEAVGSHFLADAWSSGHMWERWGSPKFAASPDDQARAILVGMVSGLIHGWRSLARGIPSQIPILGGAAQGFATYQHDQLDMPGSFFPRRVPEARVGFVQPEFPGVEPAAGDLYLLPCTAQKPDIAPAGPEGWAVAPGQLGDVASQAIGQDDGKRPLSQQYRRMLTCVALGFAQVYDDGPETHGSRALGVPKDMLEAKITSSMSDACWDQRVTNQSMMLGAGINDTSFETPGLLGHLTIASLNLVANHEANTSGLVGELAGFLQSDHAQLRVDLVRVYDAMATVTHDNGPDDAEAASLPLLPRQPRQTDPPSFENNTLKEFRGSLRNSAYVDLIDQGQVEYLEPHAAAPSDPGTPAAASPKAWHALHANGCPPTAGDPTGDSQCKPGYYCDRAVAVGQGVSPQHWCMPNETAVLRAFRDAEAPTWCGDDTLDDLDAARVACKSSTKDASSNSPECDACVGAVLIHLRNACDASDYTHRKQTSFVDPRSVCDVLKDAGSLADPGFDPSTNALYAVFEPGQSAKAHDAAMKICNADSLPTDVASSNPPTSQLLGAHYEGVCARGCGTCVWCWGLNQSGDHGSFQSPTDTIVRYAMPAGVSGVTALATGALHTCAVAKGGIYCWGKNDSGQLGTGDFVDHKSPVLVKGLGGADAITAGSNHTCALVAGNVWCWGGNEQGEIGNGSTANVSSPTAIAVPEPVTQVAAGVSSTCAVTSTGRLYCWGWVSDNAMYGQPHDPKLPALVMQSVDTQSNAGTPFAGATQVSVGGYYLGIAPYACALAGGKVYCWGVVPIANHEQTSNGVVSVVPLPLPGPVTAVSAGLVHTCALLAANGQVVCWGEESQGEIGDGQSFADGVAPKIVPNFSGAVRVEAGDGVTCAQKADGSVWCWGGDQHGQLGNGAGPTNSLVPTKSQLACP